MHVGHDGVDVFDLLLCRVGVVHAQVADAAELARDAEVEADRFALADVEVAVRLGRKAGVNFGALSAAHIFCHDVADEIGRRVGWLARVQACDGATVTIPRASCHPMAAIADEDDLRAK